MPPKSPAEMLEAIVRNLPQRTGKSLSEWTRLLKSKGPRTTKERVAWLRKEYGLGGPTATIITAEAEGTSLTEPYEDGDALVEAQYAGGKASLRPIHDALVKAAKKLGRDVTVSPRKTYVTLSRERQFAAIQPTTKTRVDLGLVLPGTKPQSRLRAAKNVGGGRVTHSIALASKNEIDGEVIRWLKAAYDADA